MQQGCVTAMVDFHHLHAFLTNRGGIPNATERSALNTQASTSIFFVTDHGRGGEFSAMMQSEVRAMVEQGRAYLVANQHKTMDTTPLH